MNQAKVTEKLLAKRGHLVNAFSLKASEECSARSFLLWRTV